MKKYAFIYEDIGGNELDKIIIDALNMRDAKRIRDVVFANSKMNDLTNIRIIPK